MTEKEKQAKKIIVQCPECLRAVKQEELDMFDGLCEICQEIWNE